MNLRIAAVLSLLLSLAGCSRSGPPYSPAEALKSFRIEPGFKIETFVTEPDIRSPVAMDIDENGRIYVSEDPGYPLNFKDKLGRIILLEPIEGGRFRRTVFADKLTMPIGVMRWKKGILVTDAPDILYLEDTDGDGKADIRKVVLTGFAFTNPQDMVNAPVYGLDNWIYLGHSGPGTAVIFVNEFNDRGSDLRFPDHPEWQSIKQARRMVRFKPDTGQIEYTSTATQYGHSFDTWGHHFTVSNEDHIRQEVVAARYLSRNPDLPAGSAMERISDHGSAAEVYPITQNARVEMLSGVGSFTSACSITVYLGGLFPALGSFSLTAEPAQNLVHRDVLTPKGATFLAKRSRESVEFLASTDGWFRPVNFTIGPDGAIYLVDYYRLVIEHPEWMATETFHSKDLYKGDDRGRIYRITPDAGLPLPWPVRTGQATDAQLVEMLASPNSWQRRTAQRLLVDHANPQTVGPLAKILTTSPSAAARVHALWTLEGIHQLTADLVEKALDDSEAGVRENAIQLAESRLKENPKLVEKLLKMEHDPDGRTQFQLLCTLGGVSSAASSAVQDRLLAQRIEDPWMQIAALSASSDRAPQLFRAAAAFTATQTPARANYFHQVAAVIGIRRKPPEIRQMMTTLQSGASWWRTATLEGLAQGLGRTPGETLSQDLMLKLFAGSDAEVRHAALRALGAAGLPPSAAPLLKQAAATAQAADRDPALRADSIGLLALGDAAKSEDLFKKLIDPQQPELVQAAAVRGLGRVKGAAVGTFLIERWKSFTPTVRMDAADAMFRDPDRPRILLNAIKKDTVQTWTLAFRHKRQLLMHTDAALREEARVLFEDKAGAREAVLKNYQAALDMPGDAERGRAVFERVCSKCHRLNAIGHEVGPDLATIRNRPPQLILPDIIIPSRNIAQNYESYVVETKSRGIIEGVMGPQTPTTITIRHEEGKEDVIPRSDIKEMRITNLSAMPADLDKQVTIPQMADLLKFLKTAR